MDAIDTTKNTPAKKASGARVWLFRLLVVAAVAVMLVAWFMPWWSMDIDGFGYDQAQIRPWGLVITQRLAAFKIMMKGTDMPGWFPTAMWAYLALCMLAILVGLFSGGKKLHLGKLKFSLSQLLIGGVGFSYVFAGVFAAIYASWRMGKTFGVALQGRTHIDMGDPFNTYVNTTLEPGWYLVFVAGLLLLVLAFLQDKITRENKLEA